MLGQVQSGVGRDPLLDRLRDTGESDMVRHECAEALGSIAGEGIEDELKRWVGTVVVLSFSSLLFLEWLEKLRNELVLVFCVLARFLCMTKRENTAFTPSKSLSFFFRYLGAEEPPVLRESCVVALDMADYANSEEFQYANTLTGAQ